MSPERKGSQKETKKSEQVQFVEDPQAVFDGVRPPLEKRKFVSPAVEAKIVEVKAAIADPKLARMFENCFPNTLDTTIDDREEGGFVTTGNIPAMWLRDSTNQMLPYLNLVNEDNKLKGLFQRVIRKQAEFVLRDQYANAFNKAPDDATRWDEKDTRVPGVYERKWELDSLANFLRLSLDYHEVTGDISIFDDDWQNAAKKILETFRKEQRKAGSEATNYEHDRETDWEPDQVINKGKGAPANSIGFIYSAFRPSDDRCEYSFLVPSNMLAVVQLDRLSDVYREVLENEKIANECKSLSTEVRGAIERFGKIYTSEYGGIYVYETDAMGNHLLIDDANTPSLLSIPEFGYCDKNDFTYQTTRKFVLSHNNLYYFEGDNAKGIGSYHTTNSNEPTEKIWPLAIIMQARTSDDSEEIKECLRMVRDTDNNTHYIHESFNKDNPAEYTRAWFAWPNGMFGKLIVDLYNDSEKRKILSQI